MLNKGIWRSLTQLWRQKIGGHTLERMLIIGLAIVVLFILFNGYR